MKKKLAVFLIMALAGLAVSGCSCSKQEEEPAKPAAAEADEPKDPPAEPEEEAEPEEPEEVIPENENLLTGVPDLSDGAIGKRPVAVMVNNIPAAMPQYGVEEADLIFEIPVDGDQTRFMALYGDYTKVPKVCAIRSCRAYFPAISQGFDAFYVNWGIDESMGDYSIGTAAWDKLGIQDKPLDKMTGPPKGRGWLRLCLLVRRAHFWR